MSSQVMQHYDWCIVNVRTEGSHDPAIRCNLTIDTILLPLFTT